MYQAICFLNTSGMYVSPGILDLLRAEAVDLATSKEHRRDFSHAGVCMGSISTQYRTVALGGTISGVKFEATLEINNRTFKVSFIVDERFLFEFVSDGFYVYASKPTEQQSARRDTRTLN